MKTTTSNSPRQSAPSPDDAIESAAADWIARRNGGLRPGEESALAAWLAADPRHAAAFAEFDIVWATLNHPRRAGQAVAVLDELESRARARARRRGMYLGVAAGLAAAAALVFAFLPAKVADLTAVEVGGPPTAVLRPDTQTLPDGSVVELNAGAEIAPVFTADRRGVKLLRGEALFTVAHDAAHPFIVEAGGVKVRAVGTAFSVRCAPEEIGVLVTEGRVAVERDVASPMANGTVVPAAEPTYLDVGHKVVVAAAAPVAAPLDVKTQTPEEIASALAWRGKRVEFTDTPLAEAVELFNRQNRLQLTIRDPAIRDRRITGIFWADDPAAFVRLLETGLGLKADRTGDSVMLRSR